MSITILSQGRDITPWIQAIKKKRPELEIRLYPNDLPKEDVEFALAWSQAPGVLNKFPNLKCIASLGAGADHILKDPALPPHVEVTRIVDENLTRDMATFVTALVLNHVRGLHNYKIMESSRTWKPGRYLRSEDVTVGIMGLGVLGSEVARYLLPFGFNITGWSRSEKQVQGLTSFAGATGLQEFLSGADILICLLPLTSETSSILNRTAFQKLPEGAFVVNVARGEHLVEEDLLEMLDNGHLSGASLDVFREEPLPAEHPFWTHPKINITPHIASITNPDSAVVQLLENYDRLKNGKPLQHVVSREHGY